jgi:DNA polymerase-3 subunit epsilon
MRFVVLDTETTGFNKKGGCFSDGHRLLEIACVEVIDDVVTGKYYHTYLNPECDIDDRAVAVHGIQKKDVLGKPKFEDVVESLLQFIGNDVVVIHNAPFDIDFLDKEFSMVKEKPKRNFSYIDTLQWARSMFPGMGNSLDSLAKKFDVGISRGDFHGALIDANILARVFILMLKTIEQNDCCITTY